MILSVFLHIEQEILLGRAALRKHEINPQQKKLSSEQNVSPGSADMMVPELTEQLSCRLTVVLDGGGLSDILLGSSP